MSDIKEKKTGAWYELNESSFKVLLLDDFSYTKNLFEAHKNYIDIHIVLKGIDQIFIGNNCALDTKTEYDQILDYYLIKCDASIEYVLTQDEFCILMPNEFHSNMFLTKNTLKLIVKKQINA